MKDYQEELLLLKERKDQLMKTINSHSFSSEKEYNQWKLMNDIEKQNYLDYLKKIEEKFNETEFY